MQSFCYFQVLTRDLTKNLNPKESRWEALPGSSVRLKLFHLPFIYGREMERNYLNKIPGEISPFNNVNLKDKIRECSGSVVECLNRDRGAAGSSLTGVTALWSLSKTYLS